MMIRYAAGVEYDGGDFYGFQRQAQTPTVQEVLEQALSEVANHPVTVFGAGRTDTGVHASGQVVHFDATRRPLRSWILGANAKLPDGCSLIWVSSVDPDFHARFAAVTRSYCYRIINRWTRPSLFRQTTAWVRQPLSIEQMAEAADCLRGEHDFSAFRASSCQAQHARRRIDAISVRRKNDSIRIDLTGNAFLHHMVRNIVGSLILVGRGDRSRGWFEEVLASRDRTLAGPTAAPSGLCLTRVTYPRHFKIPGEPMAEVRDA